jgi:hypothetical protein
MAGNTERRLPKARTPPFGVARERGPWRCPARGTGEGDAAGHHLPTKRATVDVVPKEKPRSRGRERGSFLSAPGQAEGVGAVIRQTPIAASTRNDAPLFR